MGKTEPETKLSKQEEAAFLNDMAIPVDDKIMYHYQHGQGSLQDIARVYQRFGVTIDDVLRITNNSDISSVHMPGDLISEQEKGNAGAPMNFGQSIQVPYDLQ